jgi:hypothetical protein
MFVKKECAVALNYCYMNPKEETANNVIFVMAVVAFLIANAIGKLNCHIKTCTLSVIQFNTGVLP